MAKLSDLQSCLTCLYFQGERGCNHQGEAFRASFATYGISSGNCCNGFSAGGNVRQAYISNQQALPFILAGKSEFTVVSMRTGVRISYKMKKVASNSQNEGASEFVYFVSHIHGGNSEYCGSIFFDYRANAFMYARGKKGNVDASDIRIKSLLYILNNLLAKNYGINVTVFHCGKCGRCSKRLTTPESILTGLGPECSKKAGIPRVKLS